jgi:hypothetical protein
MISAQAVGMYLLRHPQGGTKVLQMLHLDIRQCL